jgi:hypothetical protein
MIAIAEPVKRQTRTSKWQTGFIAMMPDIMKYAQTAFRQLGSEARYEAVQEVIVSAMLAYFRLYQRGKVELAYPSVLARYAIAQYRDGRRVGTKLNCHDVLSPYARRMNGIQVESLDGRHGVDGSWREVLLEDKHAGPAETAAARIDFADWFISLAERDRKIADALSDGSTTSEVARRFGISPGRISQKRREFLESWQKFHGESRDVNDGGQVMSLVKHTTQ